MNQLIIEMDGGYLFVTTISEGSALAVMSGVDADIGLIGYEMSVLVSRIGQVLTPALRGVVGATRAMIRGGGDPDGPRVVPVYALTGGRARSRARPEHRDPGLHHPGRHDVPGPPALRAGADRRAVSAPVSVAEVAAELAVPLGVARVLVSDLHADHMLMIHQPAASRPRTEILERLLSGLRSR